MTYLSYSFSVESSTTIVKQMAPPERGRRGRNARMDGFMRAVHASDELKIENAAKNLTEAQQRVKVHG